jgi:hypothetical protein
MFKSQQQSKFIHMKANQGVPWAQKFVADASHAKGSVKKLPKRLGPKKRIKKISGSNPDRAVR